MPISIGFWTGLQRLVFECGGMFIPEKVFALIPARIVKAHRVAGAGAAVIANAELVWVGKAMRLLMARRTGIVWLVESRLS